MAIGHSKTFCIFRQVPLKGPKSRAGGRVGPAANDNAVRVRGRENTSADDRPSLGDVGPILVLLALSGLTYFGFSNMLSSYQTAFSRFCPW